MEEVTKEEVLDYIKKEYPSGKGGEGYRKNLIKFLKTIIKRPINSTLLLEIPSKTRKNKIIVIEDGKKFIHSIKCYL